MTKNDEPAHLAAASLEHTALRNYRNQCHHKSYGNGTISTVQDDFYSNAHHKSIEAARAKNS